MRRSRAARIGASLLMLLFISDVLYPTAALALTSGPTQPEFTSFEPVVTTNMVNEFTGDFTYNLPILQIPGPNGGGYAMSLSYHSGASPEEEASWVGYGWTLNPGAINRQKQGIPDDWNGEQMTFYNKTIPNRTVTAGTYVSGEAFSWDIPASADGTVRYNNYNGFGYGIGAGLRFCNGLVSLGFHVNDGQRSFSLQINPAAMLTNKIEDARKEEKDAYEACLKNPSATNLTRLQSAADRTKKLDRDAHRLAQAGRMGSAYGMHALAAQNYPLANNEMSGASYKLGMGLNICPVPAEAGMNANFFGQYTEQQSTPQTTRNAFGYLHSGSHTIAKKDLMDYHSENASPFNKRDKYLPLAANDADLFNATGEGIIGGMRFYNRHPQVFRPQGSVSSTDIFQIGGEVNVGGDNGGSVDIGTGLQELTVGGPQPTQREPEAILRMSGDKGGDVGYFTNTAPENAHVQTSGLLGFKQGTFQVPGALDEATLDQGERPRASSAVGFHTEDEMANKAYRSYEKTAFTEMTNGQTAATRTSGSDHLGEISVLNEQGQRYNYGLPVQARKDVSMAYHHVNDDNDHHWSSFAGSTDSSPFKMGSSSEASYATSFLLTSITDPDYVDRTNDGPTPDDLGGYTRFIYQRHTHDGNGYFNWRIPYEGYAYSDPELSECHDNRISYGAGEKEVYYLDRVVTRTHVAVFHRAPRADGLGANPTYDGSTGWPATDQTLQKLESIDLYGIEDLYANGANARPIKTVHFEYAEDADAAWPGIPNTSASNGGKLTLKRVWFTYNGVVPVRIAPYEFEYTYPDIHYEGAGEDPPVPAYAPLDIQSGLNETPEYNNDITDPWGNYRDDGTNISGTGRYQWPYRPWLDQAPQASFDPAAWQLKVIKLPSGGQIHVQYEEDTYAYVQDEKACALLPLTAAPSDARQAYEFTIGLAGLWDLNTGTADSKRFSATDIARIIQQVYVEGKRKMFFKFLFKFDSNGPSGGRNQEFISGYVPIQQVTADDAAGTVTVSMPTVGYGKPGDICAALYNAEKRGKDLGASCSGGLLSEIYASGSTSASAEIEHLGADAGHFIGSWLQTPCTELDPAQSYFRIPVGMQKRGGGIRVHRLLMVDPQGITDGYPGVFGSEYDYRTTDEQGHVISSGVATYEPSGLREENPLVRPLDRLNQGWVDKAIAGRDRKQSEGPEGESLYPSPTVGYSRVIIRNIHQGATAPAFSAKDFYTAKEYPVRVEHTDIDAPTDYAPITTGIVDIIRDHVWASQGYTVHLNEMHGKPRREAEYTGNPNALLGDHTVNATLLSFTDYEYFGPNDDVPVLMDAQGTTSNMFLGRTCDLTIEERRVKDEMDDSSPEVDIGVALVLGVPEPTFSMMPSVSHSHTTMATHVITKVVEHPAILRRTKVYKDGIYHIAENVAFDRNTGEPLVTRTHDGFYDTVAGHDLAQVSGNNGLEEGPGTYTSIVVPASMAYDNMGQAAKGEGLYVPSVCSGTEPGICLVLHTTPDLSLEVSAVNGGSVCGLLEALCAGDLLELTNASHFGLYHVLRIEQSTVYLSKAKSWYSGDVTLANGGLQSLRILRSGRTNKLREQAGSYTYYGLRSASTPHDSPEELFAALLESVSHSYTGPAPLALTTSTVPAIPAGLVLKDLGAYTGTLQVHLNYDQPEVRLEFELGDGTTCKIYTPYPCTGHFRIDGTSGLLVYGAGDCLDEQLCVQFAKPFFPKTTIDNVVASAATEFSDQWPYDRTYMNDWDATTMAGADSYDLGERGKWRAASHYAYNAPLTPGTTNKDQGMYPMVLHNWNYPAANSKVLWVRTDTVTSYSPDGNVLEERDALGHPSCAKFGYDRTLPYLVAKNSVGGSVRFESFEKSYVLGGNNYLEDGLTLFGWPNQTLTLDNTVAHAGRSSLRARGNGLLYQAANVLTPPDMSSRGMEVKVWVRAVDADGKAVDLHPTAHVQFTAPCTDTPLSISMDRIARTGEWVLWSATFQVPSNAPAITVSLSETSPDFTTWIDDVRIQPVEAQMTSYVYDAKTFRLMATFDDQHFGLYYQYNDEGRLVRKLIETERGIRTVQETQYNTPTVAQ